MSDPVWLFRKAVRMKRRDSGNVWNHGVFYFGDLFSYRHNPINLGYQFY